MVRRLGAKVWERLRSAPEPTLAGRIALTFLVLACCFAVLLGNNQVLFITCVVAATILLSGFVTYLATARLAMERRLPERVFAGAPFDVRLRVRNLSRWRPALGLGFLDALQVSESGGHTRGPVVPVLPPRSTVEVGYTKRIHRRGIYTVVNTLAATRFPFGIFERRILVQSPARLVVLPSLGRLRRAARRDLARKAAQPLATRHAREGVEEFHSLREYRSGDNPRHIHWKTTARVGDLVRRVMHDEATEDLTILLDTYAGGLDGEMRQRNLEKAVSCAATLLSHAALRGRRAVVHYDGGSASHAGSRAGLVPALEKMAAIEAGGAKPEDLLRAIPIGRSTAVLLVSLAGDAAPARRAALARRVHLRVWDVAHPSFARFFRKR